MVDFKALAAPFPPASVSWRIGSTTADKARGMALAYIDARDVMDRLDEVCGPDGWECRYPHAGQKTVCEIGILYNDRWVYKADGAGDSDVEAEKGALSDAFKRAAVRWGIGRYLYHLPSPWVEIETKGRTSVIKDHEKQRLASLLPTHNGARPAPAPAQPKQSSVGGERMAAAEPHLIDANRVKGTLPKPEGLTKEEERAAKIKDAVDKRVRILQATKVWIKTALDQFWDENTVWINWMADPKNAVVPEYERFLKAWNEAEKNARVVELA